MTDGSNGHSWQPPQDPAGAAAQQPSPGTAAASAWSAPARPGLIPLRPLTLGTVLSASFQALRRNPRPTLGIALSTQFGVMLVTVAILGAFAWVAAGRLDTSSSENVETIGAGLVLMTAVVYLIPLALSMIATALLQGIMVIEVSRGVLGEKLTLRQLWRRTRGRMGALIGWMLLLSLAVLIAIGALAAIVAVSIVTLGTVGIVLGVLGAVFGGLALAVVAAWLSTKLAMVPSALMIERLGLGAAIRRSWRLTGGHFWRLFGIQLLVSVILGFATQIISAPASFLAPMLLAILDPTGTEAESTVGILIGFSVLTLALTVALSAVVLVIQSATTALLYIDLRMRKEGLDLELSRFVEERAAGTTTVDDPYRVGVAPTPPAAPFPPSSSPWA